MNLIIGPNGTGKSTIVSALAVVFCAPLSLLGRNTDLAAFVKHGEKSATIELSIYDPQRPDNGSVTRLKRQFNSDGKSVSFIDGNKCNTSAVRQIATRYDVQLDNLTQFMPQEKICEFATMEPGELLSLAVRSLGGMHRSEQYGKLVNTDANLAKETDDLQTLHRSINDLDQKQQDARAEVDAFQQQQELLDRAKALSICVPHLELDAEKNTLVEERCRLDQEREQLSSVRAEMEAKHAAPIKQCQAQLTASKRQSAKYERLSRVRGDSSSEILEQLDSIVISLGAKRRELNDVHRKVQKKQQAIDTARSRLQQAQEVLENVDDKENDIAVQLSENCEKRNCVHGEEIACTEKIHPIQSDIAHISRQIKFHNHQINQIGSVRDERIKRLSNTPQLRELPQIAHLIDELKREGKFRRRVFGPVAAEIDVKEPYHQRIMEGCIKGFLMGAFVVECNYDAQIILSECARQLSGAKPDIITVPVTRDGEPDMRRINAQVPSRPLDQRLNSFGIRFVVSEIYNAPDPVKAALNSQASLHNIHVGDEHTERPDIETALRKEDGLWAWYTPSRRVQTTSSKYKRGALKALSHDYSFEYVTGKLFGDSMEAAERERQRLNRVIREDEQSLTEAKTRESECQSRSQAFKRELGELQVEYRTLCERKKRLLGAQKDVVLKEQHVKNLEDQLAEMNIEEEKQSLADLIANKEQDAHNLFPRAQQLLQQLCEAKAELDKASVEQFVAHLLLDAEKEKHADVLVELQGREKQLQDDVAVYLQRKKIYKSQRLELRASGQDASIHHQELLEELREKYRTNVEPLRQEISDLEIRAQGLTTGGRRVLEEYNHRQQQLEKQRADLEAQTRQQDERMAGFRHERTEFLKWLHGGVEKMRKKFSSLYSRLGCSGDLVLIGADAERLSEVTLQVLVSYRDDVELRPISASANSGGEKMCCTMLFCFSLLLEEERMPPFVFVDELNQGLDVMNEMKIMTMMFEDAERESAPQSFVITPKMLMNMPFHGRTKSHIIFNGSVVKADIAAPSRR